MPLKVSEIMKLGDLVNIQPGYQFRGRVENDPEGDGYLIQLKDFTESGEFKPKDLTKISLKGINDKYHLQIGDILIPSRGQYTFSVFIKSKIENTVAAGYFYILRPKSKNVDSEYLSWFLNSKPAQAHLSKFKRGTNILSLSRQGLEELLVPIVPKESQKQIAEISKLSKKEATISERLQELRSKFVEESILQELF
jgi:restriction endonuclease S subunit